MRKVLKSMLFACVVMFIGIAFNSCTEETGDHMYDVTTSSDTSTGSYMSYKASGAESTIFKHVKQVATEVSPSSTYVIINGGKNDCDKKIKAAVNAGMDEVEAGENYGKLFDLTSTTVVIKESDKVIFSRTFKKI